jgi:chromosomal replication initiator protein
VRHQLRASVTDFTFHIWLEPLELAADVGDRLFVRAPDHIRTWVRERYLHILSTAASRALDRSVTVEIVDSSWTPPTTEPQSEPSSPITNSDLNPKYTFQQFVIGHGNRFAHAAALTVAEMPAQAYNPLFIHGSPGLGKTHLLHAIGNYVRRYGLDMRVRYATIEEFISEFTQAVQDRRIHAFKQRFRASDILLIDDVQFLQAGAKTMEEFFHTFNSLYESGSQLVIASDRRPSEIGDLETRLRERFESGLVADLEPPDLNARLTILRKRADVDNIGGIAEETLIEIAARATSSVRSLEGALIRVVAYSSLINEPPTPDIARQVLGGVREETTRPVTVIDIQKAAAASFGVSRDAMLSKDRSAQVSKARQVAIYLSRELTRESLPTLATHFARSHTTLVHAHRKVASQIPRDDSLNETLTQLRGQLKSTPPAGSR